MKRILAFILSMIVVFSLCILPVTAAESPTPKEYYSITIGTQGDGRVEVNKTSVEKDSEDIVMLIATENTSNFIKWTLTGDYEIINGDLNSKVLRLKPHSDIVAVGVFKGGEDKNPVIIEKTPVSPKTGQNPLTIYLILAIMTVAAGLGMVSWKNIKHKN